MFKRVFYDKMWGIFQDGLADEIKRKCPNGHRPIFCMETEDWGEYDRKSRKHDGYACGIITDRLAIVTAGNQEKQVVLAKELESRVNLMKEKAVIE